MQELRDEMHKLSLSLENLVQQRIGFNGDKRELFDRMISVESKVDNLNDSFTRFINTLPCRDHYSKLSQIELNAEKGKVSTLTIGFSFLFSTVALVGIILEILSK